MSKQEYKNLFHLPLVKVLQHVIPNITESELNRIVQIYRDDNSLYQHQQVKLTKHAQSVIPQLAHSYPLGIVTSREKDGVYKLPTLQPLQEYFQAVVTIEDTPEHKPHPAPLLLAAKKLQIDPKHVVYIGDAPTDFQAAQGAGMKAILFGGTYREEANAHTKNFLELIAIIQNLNQELDSA